MEKNLIIPHKWELTDKESRRMKRRKAVVFYFANPMLAVRCRCSNVNAATKLLIALLGVFMRIAVTAMTANMDICAISLI